MKKFFLLGGIALCIISIITALTNKEKIDLVYKGQLVNVEVVDIPVPCNLRNRSIKPFFKFNFEGKIYSKNLKNKYCNLIKIGDILPLKTNRSNSLFVYTDEKLMNDLFFSAVLFLIGIFLIYKGLKN